MLQPRVRIRVDRRPLRGRVASKRVQLPAKSLEQQQASKHRIMRQGHHHHHHHHHPYECVRYSVRRPSFGLIRLVTGKLVWQRATSRLRRLTFDESIGQSGPGEPGLRAIRDRRIDQWHQPFAATGTEWGRPSKERGSLDRLQAFDEKSKLQTLERGLGRPIL